jgi:2-oxoglutarate ferredoxin oxidoreductase subunit alpha
MHDLTFLAFDLADRYRNPVLILTDGRLGQMMEPLTLTEASPAESAKPWALTGAMGRRPNCVRSLLLGDGELEAHNIELQAKYRQIAEAETRWEERWTDDCEVLMVAYGTSARIAKGAIETARMNGSKVGLLRPITVWPFPSARLAQLSATVRSILVVEMSSGQMVEDVRLAVNGRIPVSFEGRMGGGVPTEHEVLERLRELRAEPAIAAS